MLNIFFVRNADDFGIMRFNKCIVNGKTEVDDFHTLFFSSINLWDINCCQHTEYTNYKIKKDMP